MILFLFDNWKSSMNVKDVQYCVNLDNEYEFKIFCHEKSLEAFDIAIAQDCYPSRFRLFTLLVSEVVSDLFYLAKKLVEIAFHILYILSQQLEEQRPFNIRSLSNLVALLTIQFCLPFVCTAIRILATVSGFLVPRWAVQGWRVAESGEMLSYVLWSKIFEEFSTNHLDLTAYEEIEPSNAIFYLGKRETYHFLGNPPDHSELKLEVVATFAIFLQKIVLYDRQYLYELLGHDSMAGSELDEQESSTQAKKSYVKNRSYSQPNHEINQVLAKFKSYLLGEESSGEELDETQLEEIMQTLSMEELQKLFTYFYFKLYAGFLAQDLKKINQKEIKFYFTQLKNLFSQQFRFGRAHFYQTSHSLHCYSRD